MSRYYLSFESTHVAMAAQKALETLTFTVIPTPRAISAGCGMTLLFDEEGDKAALAAIQDIAPLSGMATLYRREEPEHFALVKKI